VGAEKRIEVRMRDGLSCAAPQSGGWTPLLLASQNSHLAVVEALLAKGAEVEAKNIVSIARACALCPSHSLTRMQNAHGYL
jgi:ankyrin repeat protein